MFPVPDFIHGPTEMYCYKDLIISHYYKILVIYTQGYTCLFVCLFVCLFAENAH